MKVFPPQKGRLYLVNIAPSQGRHTMIPSGCINSTGRAERGLIEKYTRRNLKQVYRQRQLCDQLVFRVRSKVSKLMAGDLPCSMKIRGLYPTARVLRYYN